MDTITKWDKSAGEYQKVFKSGANEYSERLLRFLRENAMLKPGCRVIDIGCGVGRYATMFAQLGCEVTLSDISAEMLRLAAENMAKYPSGWRTLQCDFNTADAKALMSGGPYDLAISTMSPAIHDLDTVKKMSSLSRGWCVVTQFVRWEQPARDKFYNALGLESVHPMSGAKSLADDIIGFVSASGHTPLVKYEPYSWSDLRTPEETARRLLLDMDADEALLKRAEAVAAALSDDRGYFEDTVNTQVAWICWDTRR